MKRCQISTLAFKISSETQSESVDFTNKERQVKEIMEKYS